MLLKSYLVVTAMARLSVRLLVSGPGTWTAELLWLASSVVGDEESAVVGDKSLLELVLGVLIDVLLVVGDLQKGRTSQ